MIHQINIKINRKKEYISRPFDDESKDLENLIILIKRTKEDLSLFKCQFFNLGIK